MNKFVRLLAAVLMSVALAGCAAQEAVYGFGTQEGKEGESPDYMEGDTARYADDTLLVEVTYMPPEKVDLYFSRFRSGKYENPFPPTSYAVFSIGLTNRSSDEITFDPRMTQLVTEKARPMMPKDYSGIYTDLTLADARDTDVRMDAYRESSFDNSESVAPGETVRRLMVFARKEDGADGGLFVFNGLYSKGRTHSIKLPYPLPF